ncbi:hypothetical protein [Yersinia pekkanenii]|uniref:Uncharacterized protein n=1 Tax=Yersinia pekkanenii TaxID=1288385 RepID=A0A0T9R1V6_9GAMM|nr:hypothetical protein [Yersinia pekkanenii]CNI40407.1 Uncharacterised protein [Yersinia pekkanenii]CRY69091.1 Uncharacterised protein [Yersinia pekkanenii]
MNNSSQEGSNAVPVINGTGVESGHHGDNHREKELSPFVMSNIIGVIISIINTVFILVMTLFNIIGWLAVAIPVIAFWVFVACYDNSVVINREFITNLAHLSSTFSILVLFIYIGMAWVLNRKTPFIY